MTTFDYRALPPVEPIEIPRRFSMSLMAKDDDCPRSAYLFAKYRHGPSSHPLDRGTLGHAVLERGLKELIVREERSYVEPGMVRMFSRVDGVLVDELVPASPEGEAKAVATSMAALVAEVLREHPDLVVARREVDDVRELAYHWAIGYDVDPQDVAGVEQLFVLDLQCGVRISGKLDVAALLGVDVAQVDDYKTGRAMPTQEEYEGSVQPWFYAVLLCFGTPVDVHACPAGCGRDWPIGSDCEVCEGRGYVEVKREPVGQYVQGVRMRELYPSAKLRDDGTLHRREMFVHRTLVADYLADLEEKAARLLARFGTKVERCPSCHGEPTLRCDCDCYPGSTGERIACEGRGLAQCSGCGGPEKPPVEHVAAPCATCDGRGVIVDGSWDFPARSGSWCSMCPAAHECPLPEELRDHAGTVNTLAQASEAWAKTQLAKTQLAAIEKEVKTFAKAHDVAIVVGDLSWRWEPKTGRAVRKKRGRSDWDGLVDAVVEAAEFGVPFDVSEFVVPTSGSEFKKSKVTTEGTVVA